MDLPQPPGSFRVSVKPGSRQDRIVGFSEGVLTVEVSAPADKGKANARLVRFLSKQLGYQVRVKSGLASKEKVMVFV
ncbi:DUF167 domain-containing protein [Candidatus Woesearchaeota archaeon]|nr:DUF167 domain-containing protein [Candidatus Woesearchaeota archaeon]